MHENPNAKVITRIDTTKFEKYGEEIEIEHRRQNASEIGKMTKGIFVGLQTNEPLVLQCLYKNSKNKTTYTGYESNPAKLKKRVEGANLRKEILPATHVIMPRCVMQKAMKANENATVLDQIIARGWIPTDADKAEAKAFLDHANLQVNGQNATPDQMVNAGEEIRMTDVLVAEYDDQEVEGHEGLYYQMSTYTLSEFLLSPDKPTIPVQLVQFS
jgi:hypothetical protein